MEVMQRDAVYVTNTLEAIERPRTVPAGNVLFREGDDPSGVYFIHNGAFDLFYASRAGGEKPLRSAGPGQLLGLSCVVSNRAHDCSATARTPSTVGFIRRDDLQRALSENPGLWLTVLRMISNEVNACWDCMRNLGKC